MARKFKTVDYEEALEMTIRRGDVLPPKHLAHFVVFVIAQLDLRVIYQKYALVGAPPYEPEILLGLLFYGYATGVFSSRQIEKKSKESIPFRLVLPKPLSTMSKSSKTGSLKFEPIYGKVTLVQSLPPSTVSLAMPRRLRWLRKRSLTSPTIDIGWITQPIVPMGIKSVLAPLKVAVSKLSPNASRLPGLSGSSPMRSKRPKHARLF